MFNEANRQGTSDSIRARRETYDNKAYEPERDIGIVSERRFGEPAN